MDLPLAGGLMCLWMGLGCLPTKRMDKHWTHTQRQGQHKSRFQWFHKPPIITYQQVQDFFHPLYLWFFNRSWDDCFGLQWPQCAVTAMMLRRKGNHPQMVLIRADIIQGDSLVASCKWFRSNIDELLYIRSNLNLCQPSKVVQDFVTMAPWPPWLDAMMDRVKRRPRDLSWNVLLMIDHSQLWRT